MSCDAWFLMVRGGGQVRLADVGVHFTQGQIPAAEVRAATVPCNHASARDVWGALRYLDSFHGRLL